MAKIDDIVLPRELNEHLVSTLDAIPDHVLETIGREHLSGGFTKAHAIRQRLESLLRGDTPMPDWLAALYRDHALPAPTVQLLSTRALEELFDSLALTLGPEAFLLALLLDKREAVRQLARHTLQDSADPTHPEEPDPSSHASSDDLEELDLPVAQWAALETIVDYLNEVLIEPIHLLPIQLDDPYADPDPEEAPAASDLIAIAAAPEAVSSLRNEIARLERSLEDEKRHLKDEKKRGKERARDLEEKLRAETERHHAEKQLLRESLASAMRECETLRGRIQELESQTEHRIRQGVKEETSFLIRPWLAQTLPVENELSQGGQTATDLLAKVDQVIQEQAARDRHTGNRLALRKRLDEFRQARDRLADAQRHALHPLPNLEPLQRELDSAITRLEQLLGQPRTAVAPLNRIQSLIRQASDLVALSPLSDLIRSLSDHQILLPRDQRQLYAELFHRFSLLEEAAGHAAPDTESDGGWNLHQRLGRNRPTFLFIDGHNVLHLLADAFGPFFENGQPERKAREALTQRLAQLVRPHDQIQTTLFFDGPLAHTESVAPNLRVEYSGGQGANRADRRIIQELSFLSKNRPGTKCFVVSDDRAIRSEAIAHRARYVPVEAFAVVLDHAGLLSPSAS